MVRVVTSVLCVGLALVATATGDTVKRDEWRATFDGTTKLAWTHEVVTQVNGGYRVETSHWRRAGNAVREVHTLVETDPNGRILLVDETEVTPWDRRRFTVEPWGGELKWTRTIGDRPELSGKLAQDSVWSPTVIVQRVLEGELPQGKREIPTLDVPGEGVETEDYEITQDPTLQWTITSDNVEVVRDANLQLLRGKLDKAPASAILSTTAEEAPDRTQTVDAPKPEGALVSPDVLEVPGLRFSRLAPTWQLMHAVVGDQVELFGCETGNGSVVMALRMPISVPADEQQRLDLANSMRANMNKRPGDKFQLGEPELASYRTADGVRFAVSGQNNGDPIEGEAFLVDCGSGAVLVCFGWFVDRREALTEERQLLEQALEFTQGSAKPTTMTRTRVDAAGITLKIPQGWVGQPELAPNQWASPVGASRIRVMSGTLPRGVELDTAQELWLKKQRNNPALEDLEVEDVGEVEVDGRRAFRTVFKATLNNRGVQTPCRAASLAFPLPDSGFVEVIVVSFEIDANLADLDTILESVGFVESH